ncbi:MAG: HAMP domain-containing sensor histidine kinase [Candidatus Margulisiibacteriota bacterium]
MINASKVLNDEDSTNDLNIINITKKIIFVCLIATFFYVVLFYYLQNILLSGLAGISFLIYLATFLILNLKNNHHVKFLVILNTILTIGTFSHLLGKDSGIHIALIFIPVMSYTVNSFQKKQYDTWLFSAISIGLFFYLSYYFKTNGFIYFKFSSNINFLIFMSAFTCTVVISLFCIHYLVKELKLNISKLMKSNSSLQKSYIDLKQAKDEAEKLSNQADYAKLVQNIAHEFKNPLTFMRATIEMKLAGPLTDNETKSTYRILLDGIDRLNYLIPTLLGYLNASSMTKEYTLFKPNIIIKDLVAISSSTCKLNQINLTHDLKSKQLIHGIRQEIIQVLINMLTNSIEAIQTHTAQSHHQITLRTADDTFTDKSGNTIHAIRFDIEDTGIGIDQDSINNIFIPYESNKKTGTNAGLGLSISSRIIYEHNGRISIESKKDYGTTVSFWIPAHSSNELRKIKKDSNHSDKNFDLSDDFFKPKE